MPLAATLAGHHPVHVIDLPGFGLSGDPGRVLNVAEHADHLADWLEATGLPPTVVLGNSFGCQVAVATPPPTTSPSCSWCFFLHGCSPKTAKLDQTGDCWSVSGDWCSSSPSSSATRRP
jgi:surfactin synthase thioesterase subunit